VVINPDHALNYVVASCKWIDLA